MVRRAWLLLPLLTACTGEEKPAANDAPVVTITSPADGAELAEDAPLTVTALVSDPQSAVADLGLTWLVDGEAPADADARLDGDTPTLDLPGLAAGAHTIVLQAQDAQGATGTDSVAIDVVSGEAPTVAFTSPDDGSTWLAGDPVSVAVQVTDPDAARLDELTLTWGGDATGAPASPTSDGTAQFYLSDLQAGAYAISVTVTDTTGRSAAANLAFDVVEGDGDGDGAPAIEWGGDDCDDADATVYPGADEHCDDVDEDCDGETDEDAVDASTTWADADGDGFGDPALATTACTPPVGDVADATDCLDTDGTVHPGAAEVCDGVDQDCDGGADEDFDSDGDGVADCVDVEVCDGVDNDGDGLVDDADAVSGTTTWFLDADGDGFGVASVTAAACDAPAGFVADDTDCDDADADVSPAATEVCDGLDTDEDCDGAADDADGSASGATTWYADADGDGYGDLAAATSACDAPTGTVAAGTDCDDADAGFHPGAAEADCADPNDYNCDGAVGYADGDGDGWAACEECDDGAAGVYPGAAETCDGVDQDCDGDADEGFDSDTDGTADCFDVEDCDGLDNDGDGLADDADPDVTGGSAWFADADEDGFGDVTDVVIACDGGDRVADATDCDDGTALANPDATEVCDGIDNDCDATADEDDAADATVWYTDADTDGYGDPATGAPSCAAPAGTSALATDCDDADAGVSPAATERCDGEDDDCDGVVDEDDAADAGTWYTDADEDGFGDDATASVSCAAPSGAVATGGDCDDADASAWPGATETCDDADDDCNGVVDDDSAADAGTWYADGDGDGFGAGASSVSCDAPAGWVADATDCDDTDGAEFPGAAETCDGDDDDCDGTSDGPDATDAATWHADADGDGFGGATSTVACTAPSGYVADATDCDDADAGEFPGATETCDGDDDDCDGTADEDSAADAATWHADADGDGYGGAASTVACSAPVGYVANATDCDDGDATDNPGATEICDGDDDDCDGTADEPDAADAATWHLDGDGDGYGGAASTVACTAPSGYVADATDCDDADGDDFPGAIETCDGDDDDCDGTADEPDSADASAWYADSDGDGYGSTTSVTACTAPAGYVAAAGDCDDADAAELPGATETCDGDDDDCDGTADEPDAADASTWYRDADGDGYGSTATTVACTAPSGYVATSGDCDDAHAAALPGGAELCDGLDNDCDGTVDEDDAADAPTWYGDTDDDGFGDATNALVACSAPAGYVALATDCDDTADTTWPGATESCNAEDDDCDGVTDEDDASDAITWYLDADGDGYGLASSTDTQCEQPAGYVATAGECDDEDAAVHPGAAEVCDDVDEDCDGAVDDDATDALTWYADADGDGYGAASSATASCDAPTASYTTVSGDCDDATASVSPAGTESCNGTDDDCDGTTDEGVGGMYPDEDADGYGDALAEQACSGSGYVSNAEDCDDDDANTYPGAEEICDGQANDCDAAATWLDSDEDGLVTYIGGSGLANDLTAQWEAGTSTSAASITLATSGSYTICRGTWYVSLRTGIGAATLTISSAEGLAREEVVLDGAGGSSVISWNYTGELSVSGVTIQNTGTTSLIAYDDVVVDDVLFQDHYGGASGYLTITNSTFSGGVTAVGGTFTLSGSVVEDHTYTGVGGSKDSVIEDNTLRNNTRGLYTQARTITGNTFTDNTVGAYVYSSGTTDTETWTISGNTFEGSSSYGLQVVGNGGTATYVTNPRFEIDDNTFTGNTGTPLYLDMSNNIVSMEGDVFDANVVSYTTSDSPGAIRYEQDYNNGNLTITDCTFTDNVGGGPRGGAIYATGYLTIRDSTFDGNGISSSHACDATTPCLGGALYHSAAASGVLNIYDTTFTNHDLGTSTAYRYGGAIYATNSSSASMSLDFRENVTVSGNTAYYGGGVYIVDSNTSKSADFDIRTGSMVEDNTAVYGGGVYLASADLDCFGSATTTVGFHGNLATIAGGGVYIPATATGTLTSDTCDWGATGTSDNNFQVSTTASDVYNGGGRYTYGDDASFTCTATSCY